MQNTQENKWGHRVREYAKIAKIVAHDTQVDLPAIHSKETFSSSTVKTSSVLPPKQPERKQPFRKIRLDVVVQQHHVRGHIILHVKKSKLATKELIEQEIINFWTQTNGQVPDIIFLSPKRYADLTARFCIVESFRIPYEIMSQGIRGELLLKKYK